MKTGADVVVGDEVFVIDPDRPRIDPRRAIVIKAARVWLEIAPVLEDGTVRAFIAYRIRRDTQNESTRSGFGGMRFFTLEQWAARLDRQRAQKVLRDAGLEWRLGHPWSDEELGKLAGAVSAILAARDGAEVPE